MGFDPDKYLASKSFDPDAYLNSKKNTEAVDDISGIESALRGAAQGASLGFADEATAGVESLFTDKTYTQARDESRAAYEAAKNANPNTYLAGELGGGVATAFIPGLNLAKGASLAKMAAQGAGIGAAAGLGASEADLTEGELGGALADTAIGAGLGAVAAPVIAAIPKVASLGAKGLKGTGEFLVEKTPGARSLIDSFKRAKAGEKIASKEALASKTASLQNVIEKEITPALKAVEGGEELRVKSLLKEIGEKQTEIDESIRLGLKKRAEGQKAKLKSLKADYEATQKSIEQHIGEEVSGAYDTEKSLLAKSQAEYNQNLKDIEKQTDKLLELQKQEQIATNTKEHHKIVQETVDTAEKIQNIHTDAQKSVKSQYDFVENEAEKSGVVVDTTKAMSTFFEILKNDTKITALEMKNALKKMAPYQKDSPSVKDYLEFKRELEKITGSDAVLTAKGAAKKDLHSAFNAAIEKSGRDDLKQILLDANRKWSALRTIEAGYIKNIVPKKDISKNFVENATIATVKSFGEPGKDLAVSRAQNFRDVLGKLLPNEEIPQLPKEFVAPETAESIIQRLDDLGARRQKIESFTPTVASREEALASNPEAMKIKELLNELEQRKLANVAPDKSYVEKALGANVDYTKVNEKIARLKAVELPLGTAEGLAAAKQKSLAANPEYQQLGDLLAKTKQEVPEVFSKLFGNQGQENVASFLETPGALEKVQQIFKNSRIGTESTKVEAQLDLDKMFDAISKTNPEQATALKAKLTDMSRGLELTEKSLKTSLLDNGSLLHKAMGTGEAAAIRLGEGLGAGSKAVSDFSGKALVKTGETLNKLIGNDAFVAKLPEMANHFASKGMGKFAAMLNKIHSSPIGMRKALIYTLVQEPEFRREIKKFNLEPVK